jgi:hypothetical protein
MKKQISYPSKRLFLALMLCACAVILLQNHNVPPGQSFTVNLLCMLGGMLLCALMFIPAVLIKKRTGSDFLTVAAQKTPKLRLPLACFYCLYFVYAAEYFLIPYTRLFTGKYYTGVSPCVIALLLLAVCVYAAFKGANIVTRFGIFLFAFAIFTNILLFAGSVSSLDFTNNSVLLRGDAESSVRAVVYFAAPAFIAVIFACLSGGISGFKLRQPLFSLLFTSVKFGLVIFFVAFALGKYAERQDYQSFILSRVAHFGAFAGVESFFTALLTMSVFMIISLFLCCMERTTGKEGRLRTIITLTAIIFALRLIAEFSRFVADVLTNDLIMLIFSFAAAFVIPLAYIWIGGKTAES